MHSRSVHVLLRVPSKSTSIEEIVAAHDEIAKRYGGVWFGIMTRPLSEDTLTAMRDQIENHGPAYFYLVQRRDGQFRTFRSDVKVLCRELPREKKNCIPSYYDLLDLIPKMKSWLKITTFEKTNDQEFGQLLVDSTGTNVTKALERSMLSLTTVFRE
jgi:hypothetical protein